MKKEETLNEHVPTVKIYFFICWMKRNKWLDIGNV